MKSLIEFRQEPILEEEKTDYSKFDALVRAGLANKAQLQRIHKILDKMQEDKPVFNNADRMILQNLFNKMVDLLTTNKQIFSQARRSVNEGVIDSSDYKVSPETGKKYKAHRVVLSKEEPKEKDELKEQLTKFDPPFVLVLKRKAIRLYPDSTRIALYYNDKLNKYFSVPYSTEDDKMSVVQAEEVELEEAVIDQLHKIIDGKQAQKIKFGNGQTKSVDHFTASAVTQLHKALNDENKKKVSDMIHKSPEHFNKVASFAFSKVK